MVRDRTIFHVRYGHAADALKLLEELKGAAQARGWAETTVWLNIAGPFNELVVEADYPDLAAYEREGAARMADAEFMKLFRSGVEHVIEGTMRSEVFVTPSPPAG